MTIEEAKKIIHRHVMLFSSMPDDVLEAIQALEQEPKWIPVSERLPEERSHVLVCGEDGYIDTDDYFSYGFDDWEDDVIAWMPLPKPYEPQESEDDAR